MAITKVQDLVDAELNGQTNYFTFRKVPNQVTAVSIWFDLSMSPGIPVPQYYAAAPLVATPLKYSADGGIVHGAGIYAPKTKYIKSTTHIVPAAVPISFILCDYLLFYAFVDESVSGWQYMDNTTTLTRNVSGLGNMIMVVVTGGQVGGQTFQVQYTNSDGVTGRLTPVISMNAQATNGTIITSAGANAGSCGPFLPLQAGDTGVRKIEAFQMVSGTDIGLVSLVIVNPKENTQCRGADAVVEKNYFLDAGCIDQIEDDAYLNYICLPSGSLSGAVIMGDITTVWN